MLHVHARAPLQQNKPSLPWSSVPSNVRRQLCLKCGGDAVKRKSVRITSPTTFPVKEAEWCARLASSRLAFIHVLPFQFKARFKSCALEQTPTFSQAITYKMKTIMRPPPPPTRPQMGQIKGRAVAPSHHTSHYLLRQKLYHCPRAPALLACLPACRPAGRARPGVLRPCGTRW